MADQPTAGDSLSRGRLAVADQDPDAPTARTETPTAAMRRAIVEGVKVALVEAIPRAAAALAGKASAHPRLAHALRMMLMTLTVGGITVGGYTIANGSSATECDPLVMQYALHMAVRGQAVAETLRAKGDTEAADAVLAMTDPNKLPDDLRLCLLLEQRQAAQGAQ